MCRAPRYVAPPPNNIIFANIHNRAVINNVINRPPQPAAPVAGPGAGAWRQGWRTPRLRPVAPGQGGATPTLPPAVAQRATLIQQGKAPVPPSATINPAARAGLPGAGGRPEGRTRRSRPMRRARCLRPSLCRGPTPCRFRVPGARHPRLRALRYRQAPSIRTRGLARRLRDSGSDRSRRGSRFQARHRRDGSRSARWPAETGRLRSGEVVAPPPSAAAPPKPAAAIAPKPQLQPELRRAPPPAAVHVARPPPPAARVAPAPPPRMAAATAEDGRAVAATKDGRATPTYAAPPPRMAAPPPPRMAAPPPPGWLRHRRVRLRRRRPGSARRALDADC